MARIELRNCTIKLKDGLAGTAVNNQPVTPPVQGDTDLDLTSVSLNTDDTDLVPVGARFTIAGETDAEQVHVVTARTPADSSPTTNIVFTPALGAGTYSNAGAGTAGAVVETLAGGGGNDEVQTIAIYTNNVTGGTFTLTIDLAAESAFTTAAIAYDADAATIETAIDVAATLAGVAGWTNGDISVTGGPLTTTPVVLTFDGTSVANADHALTVVNAGSLTATLGNEVLTFASQELAIKIGDGDLNYTENDEYIYDLDRDVIDGVRRGPDVPMEVSLNFIYEHITTGTGELIAPMDAIKRRNGAEEWVSSSDDLCEPYAVDLVVEHAPICGSAERERTTFPDFRSEQRQVNFRDANIAITGRCNATEPIVERYTA